MFLRGIPLLILALFAADVALSAAPLIDQLAGSPFNRLRNFIDVSREASLPTWYSSMQWFCAGVLFALAPLYAWRRRLPGMAALAGLALVCLVFSADEVAGMHEWLGKRSDVLLPGGERAGTVFWRTGPWPFVIGVPVIALLAVMIYRARKAFAPAPRSLRLLALGFGVMFAGALVVELAMNLIEEGAQERTLLLLQNVTEEFLEMLGVSIIVWSAYELLRAYGFELRAPHALSAPASAELGSQGAAEAPNSVTEGVMPETLKGQCGSRIAR